MTRAARQPPSSSGVVGVGAALFAFHVAAQGATLAFDSFTAALPPPPLDEPGEH